MTTAPDERLTELLERTADRVPVGPAPLLALEAGAARARRRRGAVAVLASAAAVAAVETCLTPRPAGVDSIAIEPWSGDRDLPLGTVQCRMGYGGSTLCTSAHSVRDEGLASWRSPTS